MNAAQIEYFLERLGEEADRKRKMIRNKYPILKCLPDDLSLAYLTFTDAKSHDFLMPQILAKRAQCMADLQKLDAAVAALKDFCILGEGDRDMYSQLKDFIAEEF